MTDPYTIQDRSHANDDGDWIDAADRDEARAERDWEILQENRRREMIKIGPFIVMKAKYHPAYLKAEKMARCLTENTIDDILAGRKHLHGNPVRKKGVPNPILQDWKGNPAVSGVDE